MSFENFEQQMFRELQTGIRTGYFPNNTSNSCYTQMLQIFEQDIQREDNPFTQTVLQEMQILDEEGAPSRKMIKFLMEELDEILLQEPFPLPGEYWEEDEEEYDPCPRMIPRRLGLPKNCDVEWEEYKELLWTIQALFSAEIVTVMYLETGLKEILRVSAFLDPTDLFYQSGYNNLFKFSFVTYLSESDQDSVENVRFELARMSAHSSCPTFLSYTSWKEILRQFRKSHVLKAIAIRMQIFWLMRRFGSRPSKLGQYERVSQISEAMLNLTKNAVFGEYFQSQISEAMLNLTKITPADCEKLYS